MKFIRAVLNIIKYLFTVLILILSLIILINIFQIKILNKTYPSFLGYSYFKVVSNSMAPGIIKNDIIIIKKQDKYQIDDIITYIKDKSFITHRIVGEKDKFYLTKGDANNIGDDPILKSKAMGKVVKVLKGIGIWKDIILTPQVLILLIITLLLFNDSFKDWTKSKFYYLQDFKLSKNSIIEEKGDINAKKKK